MSLSFWTWKVVQVLLSEKLGKWILVLFGVSRGRVLLFCRVIASSASTWGCLRLGPVVRAESWELAIGVEKMKESNKQVLFPGK